MRGALIASLIIAVLAVAFALVNNEPVAVNLGVTEFNGSLALVILVTLFVGVLVGVLASLPSQMRARRRIKELRRQLTDKQTKDEDRSGPSQTPPSTHMP